MSYKPIYEFFDSWESFVDGTPYRVAKDDRPENLIVSGEFNYSKYGGCLDGSLDCQYEMTTLVREGDFLLARTTEDGPAVYAGRIVKFNHKFIGKAQILTFGFTKWFNDFAVEQEIFVGDLARDVLSQLADRIRQNLKPYFRIQQINSGTFIADDISGARIFDVVAAHKSLRTEINRLAVIAGDICYGFFDGGETGMVDFTGPLPLLSFQVIQGSPPRGLRVSIGREAELAGYSKNEDQIVNSVHLYGATAAHSWVSENWGSIAKYGLRRRWLQKPDLEDQNQAQAILDYILERAGATRETFEIRLNHSNRAGDSLNFNERGFPFPWKERIQLMDLTGAARLSNQPTREMTISMGGSLSVGLKIGDNEGSIEDELEEIFGVTLEETPFSPQIIVKSGGRESTSVYTSLPHPPLAFPLVQKTGAGDAIPSIPDNEYNVIAYSKETGDADFQTRTVTKGIPYCELFRILEWASAGTPEYYDIDNNLVTFCNYVDSNGDRQRWNQQAGLWDWAFRDWQGSIPSYQTFVRKRYRRFLLDANNLIHAGQRTPHFPADGTVFLKQENPGEADPAYYVSLQIPMTLALHLAGTMKGLQSGAVAAGQTTNYWWVNGSFNGVWSHYATRFPYEPTFTAPQSDRYPGDGFAYYFTPQGAEKAILEGFFYEPVISFLGAVPNPLDLGAEDSDGRAAKWDIVDYLATDEFIRAISGSIGGAFAPPTLPVSTFTARLQFVKRNITDLIRIGPEAHRSPLPSETSVSRTYGLPRYQNWEWYVEGWDTDYSNQWE